MLGRYPPVSAARGLSLVELMVGITIGLIVVAGATLLTATQLSENRRLLLETQVQQDLRAAADIVTRELRRGGYIFPATDLMWSPLAPTIQPAPNPHRGIELNAGGDVVTYRYTRPGTASPFSFGYQWTSSTGVVRQRIGGAPPQDLTDRTALVITNFDVQTVAAGTQQFVCPELCADGTQNCWPTMTLNDAVVTIAGHPVGNVALTRTVTSRVRLRNEGPDFVGPACP